MPDVDMDFPYNVREEVLMNYIKYPNMIAKFLIIYITRKNQQ